MNFPCPDLPHKGDSSIIFEDVLLPQYDPESSALPLLGLPDEKLALMVLSDDAFGKAQPQAPASFFSGKSGFEDLLQVLFGYPLAGIRDIHEDLLFQLLDADRDITLAFNGIQGILQQVLDDPIE